MFITETTGFLSNTQAIIALLTGLVSLIGAGTSVFILIKNLIKNMKNNTKEENWKLIMAIADAAMTQAESTSTEGGTKKEIVIAAVKGACASQGIDISNFLDQLDAYIDNTITVVNQISAAKVSATNQNK